MIYECNLIPKNFFRMWVIFLSENFEVLDGQIRLIQTIRLICEPWTVTHQII